MSLHNSDFQKLAKLLGMVGSASDGEALNAARKAQALIQDKGVTWFDAFGITETVTPVLPHQELARDLLKHKTVLDTFERNFLVGILGYKNLSEKQASQLETIRLKVEINCEGG